MEKKEKELLSKHEQRSKDGFDALAKYVIEQKACNYCGSCVSICPKDCLVMVRGKCHVARPEDCIKCMLCELRCPDFAIEIETE